MKGRASAKSAVRTGLTGLCSDSMMTTVADSPPIFTLEEVNALMPRLKPLVAVQMDRRGEIEDRLQKLATRLGAMPDSIQIEEGDPPDVRGLKRDLAERVETYHAGWREVEGLGAVLKDPRTGLVDFYGMVDGKLVWLCWKHGEDAVMHYHGLQEGFAARKPIENAMRARHLN
jgi:hypothetical protein